MKTINLISVRLSNEQISTMTKGAKYILTEAMWFNEQSGTNAADAVGDNDGTVYGAQWSSGKFGNSLYFDGVDDYARVFGYKGITGSKARTLSVWIKTTSAADGAVVIWGDNDVLGHRWQLGINANDEIGTEGAPRIYLKGATRIGSTDITADNDWHHIAVVLPDIESPDAEDIDIYVDGVLENSTSATVLDIATGYTEDVHIGKAYWGDSFQQGYIDDVRIYGYALSEVEIAELAGSDFDNMIAYDDNGNMKFDGRTRYGYDINGRLADIDEGDVVYKYDALGRLAISTTGGVSTYYYYDTTGRVIAEYSTEDDGVNLDFQRSYIWGGGFNELLAVNDGSTIKYALTDALGSVTGVYNATTGTTAFTTYDVYGNSETAPASPYGFAGMRLCSLLTDNCSLYLTPNRAYGPKLGRWLQPDPLGTMPNPQTDNVYSPLKQYSDGMNLYQYVGNEPIQKLVHFGLECNFYVYCRDIEDLWAWTYLFGLGPKHCEIKAGKTPDSFAKYGRFYPTSVDRSDSRRILGGNYTGKRCKCATCDEIQDCIRGSYQHQGKYGNNCHTATSKALSKCCLKTKWLPSFYSDDIRCIEWEIVSIIDPATKQMYTSKRCVKYNDLPDYWE